MGQQSLKPAHKFEWPEKVGFPAGSPDRTTEFSFMLRPDAFGGIGVFATHPINAGVPLLLFDESHGYTTWQDVPRDEVPGEFIKFCIEEPDGTVTRPVNFTRIDLVWFLNHSDHPNAAYDENFIYVSLRDIAAGEEILIDYGTLEP